MGKIVWSVQLEANSWNDDLFNGTFKECVEYCSDNDYAINGEEARLAKIELDENECVDYTHEIVEEI